jgi:hypothetical protein
VVPDLVTDEDEVVHAEGDGGDDDAKDGEEDPVLSHTEHGACGTSLPLCTVCQTGLEKMKKSGFFIYKKPAQWFFVVFLGFLVFFWVFWFFGFFYIFAQKREFF